MRLPVFLALPVIAISLMAPALADPIGDVKFSLDSLTGAGYVPEIAPDADTCLGVGCVLFTGTLTNTDDDPTDTFPMMLTGISVAFAFGPANNFLSVDNTFYEDVPLLSTDPDYNSDSLGNPPDTYSGDLFGIDIAPGAVPGVYSGTVTIAGEGGLGDENYSGFTISQDTTVTVLAPEPGGAGLLLAGLLSFTMWRGAKLKWRSSEASR